MIESSKEARSSIRRSTKFYIGLSIVLSIFAVIISCALGIPSLVISMNNSEKSGEPLNFSAYQELSRKVNKIEGDIAGVHDQQVITNKIMTDPSNSCRSTEIGTSAGNVMISQIPPVPGAVLVARSENYVSWQVLPFTTVVEAEVIQTKPDPKVIVTAEYPHRPKGSLRKARIIIPQVAVSPEGAGSTLLVKITNNPLITPETFCYVNTRQTTGYGAFLQPSEVATFHGVADILLTYSGPKSFTIPLLVLDVLFLNS